VRVAAEFVRRPAAWNDDAVEVGGIHFGNHRVADRRIAVLSSNLKPIARTGGDDFRSGLKQPQFRIPVLEVLVVLIE
jgi:hypothetical protein